MAELIISISGVRGIVGETLGPVESTEFGMAYGTFLQQQKSGEARPRICIGRDSRPSGPMLAAALGAGLMATGCDIVDLRIVTTPGVGLMIDHLACDGGIVMTASHNPIEYNGIKFLRDDGIAYPADEIKQIHQNYFNKTYHRVDSIGVGEGSSNSDTHALHIRQILKICDKNLIASKHYKVVLDSINGAGCVVTADLLSELGCELIHLNDQPTGHFAHRPEPVAENLTELGPQILQHHAAIGFVQDPDGDRLALFNEKGEFIGEEYTLALAAKYRFSKKSGTAAANLSTSRMIDSIAEAAGGKVIRTPVGEAHVANAMKAENCMIGGEGNGGVIDLRIGPVRNSLAAIAMILQLMAESGKSLIELVSEIPAYSMLKTKFACEPDQAQQALERVKTHYAAGDDGAKVDTRDGIRIDLPEGWVQLRASNTEPIMRLMAESSDQAATQNLIDQVKQIAGI